MSGRGRGNGGGRAGSGRKTEFPSSSCSQPNSSNAQVMGLRRSTRAAVVAKKVTIPDKKKNKVIKPGRTSARGRGGGRITRRAPRMELGKNHQQAGKVKKTENSPKPKPIPVLDFQAVDSPAFKVFNNPLLFGVIANYLDLPALKELSRTGRFLRDLTLNSKQFINSTALNIASYRSNSRSSILTRRKPGFDTINTKAMTWKDVTIEVKPYSKKHLKIIKEILGSHSFESLQLRTRQGFPEPRLLEDAGIQEMILCVNQLKTLSLDIDVLTRCPTFLNESVMTRLISLQKLRIVPHPIIKSEQHFPYPLYTIPDNAVTQHTILHTNMAKLACMPITALRVLHLMLFPTSSEGVEPVIQILERHKATVQDLAIHGFVWNSDALNTIVFPRLHTFCAKANAERAGAVAVFLQNQPLLQNFDVNITGIMRSLELPDMVRARSTKFKKLSIRWVHFVNIDGNRLSFDWSFILGLNYLEELTLDQAFLPNDQMSTLSYVLRHIPPTLRKTEIAGIRPGHDLYNGQAISSFIRLAQVTKLDLVNARNAVTDTRFQWICENMTKLLEFSIQSCDGVTDYGLTGKTRNVDTGISLANLKGLRRFGITKCRNVYFGALLSVVAHLELKELCVTAPVGLLPGANQRNVIQLASQNPSLEILKLVSNVRDYAKGFALRTVLNKIQKRVPRFKSLQLQMIPNDDWLHLDLDLDSEDDYDYSDDSDGFDLSSTDNDSDQDIEVDNDEGWNDHDIEGDNDEVWNDNENEVDEDFL